MTRPIYAQTAKNGHFGHAEFGWEKTDKAGLLAGRRCKRGKHGGASAPAALHGMLHKKRNAPQKKDLPMRAAQLFVCVSTAVLVSACHASAQTLTFESQASPGTGVTYRSDYSESGYQFSSSLNSPQAFGFYQAQNPSFAGSTALFNAGDLATTTLTRTDGGAFTLQSVDLAPSFTLVPSVGPRATTMDVTFLGTRADTTTVSQTFAVDYGALAFQTFTFSSGFSSLVSLSYQNPWAASSAPQLDNVRIVPAAVPEPTSLVLLGVGLLGLTAARRGRRRTTGRTPGSAA